MTASPPVVFGLPLVGWIGHAALVTLVLASAAVTRSLTQRTPPVNQCWARFWASLPWLATAACSIVVGSAVTSVLEVWGYGFASGWSPVRLLALTLGEELSIQWMSVAIALGAWTLLLLWRPALRLSRAGRIKFACALVCFWTGLGGAAWCGHAFLLQLPQTLEPPYLPFEALAASRNAFARGALALALGVGVGGGLVAWALWDAPPESTEGRGRWIGSVAVGLVGGTVTLALAPLGSRLAWENAHPFDPRFAFTLCDGCVVPWGLEGRGPHPLVEGPVVHLGADGSKVDGVPCRSYDELRTILRHKRELWQQLNPKLDFPGALVFNARDLGTVAELAAAFRAVLAAGYPKAHLAYSEVLQQTRPIFGVVVGRRNSARRVFLAEWRGDCPAATARVLHLGETSPRSVAMWANDLGADADGNVCVILPSLGCASGRDVCREFEPAGLEVVRAVSLGKQVEAVQLRRAFESYQVALVGAKSSIDVELMNDPRDPWDGFHVLEARTRRAGQRLIWAMNAGMYHPDRSPVGLLVSDEEARTPLNTRRGKGNFFLMPNGVFEVSRFGTSVQTSDAWRSDPFPYTREATQSGPMLVISGKVNAAFEPGSPSRVIRNGVGVTADGVVVMAISTSRVNFYEFASLMRDLGCPNALYLDGNVSSVFAPGLERRDPGLGLGPVLVVTERT